MINIIKKALLNASTDIFHWVELAKRQREEIPNSDFCPYAPTVAGIEKSKRVLEQISEAMKAIHEGGYPLVDGQSPLDVSYERGYREGYERALKEQQ